jgi:hypothetical protein
MDPAVVPPVADLLPAPLPADGLPHLAAPALPAQPGPVGGIENVGPAPAPVEVPVLPEAPVAVPGAPA